MKTIKKRISLEQIRNREYPNVRQGINENITLDEKGCPIVPVDVKVDEYLNENPNYGKIDNSFIVFPIMIEQTVDNNGLYTDEEFEEAINLINAEVKPKVRLSGLPIENYYTYNEHFVSGVTESQLERVKSYNQSNPYTLNLNLADLPSRAFTGVIDITENSVVYVIGGEVDSGGKYVENTGIIYETFDFNRIIENPLTGVQKEIPLTTFKYFTKGFRPYNTSLFANIKEEKYLGIVFKPIVDNDVFIDRGTVNVMERHLKTSEIDSVEQLQRYGQGFFNVVTS